MTNAAPTLAAVKLALRVDEDESDSQLVRNIAAATELANRQAPGAPESVGHEAVIRMCGWLYEGPQAPGEVSEAGGWLRSGAAGLLSRWQVRRAGAISTREATPSGVDEETIMATLPSVRLLTLAFANPGLVFSDLVALTAPEVLAAGIEVPAVTQRAVSIAAPIDCHQQVFFFNRQAYQWIAVAVPDGGAVPSHYVVKSATPPNAWNLPSPPSGTVQAGTVWRQAAGQAVDAGLAYDLFWWPQVFTTFPESTVFEWPA